MTEIVGRLSRTHQHAGRPRVTGPAGGWQGIDLDEMMAGIARRMLDVGEPEAE
ncbi:hypothetical protein [Micromonospora pisi]|uniref:hypothetical protein n=1 Tax=Micromonospora pisi TaxID=589240 RepID=UPI0014775715|nr:hypothetical protein [Micromonospora pisi]